MHSIHLQYALRWHEPEKGCGNRDKQHYVLYCGTVRLAIIEEDLFQGRSFKLRYAVFYVEDSVFKVWNGLDNAKRELEELALAWLDGFQVQVVE